MYNFVYDYSVYMKHTYMLCTVSSLNMKCLATNLVCNVLFTFSLSRLNIGAHGNLRFVMHSHTDRLSYWLGK